MTIYQKINSMGTRYKDDQAAAQSELEDNIYELLVYAMDNNLPLKAEDANLVIGAKCVDSSIICVPYGKSLISMAFASGNVIPVRRNDSLIQFMSDKCMSIETITTQYGGYIIYEKLARASMNNLHARIKNNSELHAFLLLQGFNIDDIFMINRPYEDPIKVESLSDSSGSILSTFSI